MSAFEVLDGNVNPEQLTGKLVLFSLTGSGLKDMHTCPLGELVPGVEIQAQVLESLFDRRFLLRPWWMKWQEAAAILIMGLWLVWFIPRTEVPFANLLRTIPRATQWLTLGITLALNVSLVTLCFLLFKYFCLLFIASSFFIILSGIMGILVSSAKILLDLEKAQAG